MTSPKAVTLGALWMAPSAHTKTPIRKAAAVWVRNKRSAWALSKPSAVASKLALYVRRKCCCAAQVGSANKRCTACAGVSCGLIALVDGSVISVNITVYITATMAIKRGGSVTRWHAYRQKSESRMCVVTSG